MVVASRGGELPTGATSLSQRRTLVGPVAFVHAGAFAHHDCATAFGAPRHVTNPALGQGARVVGKVGDVWPEHHAVLGNSWSELDRFEEIHGLLILAEGEFFAPYQPLDVLGMARQHQQAEGDNCANLPSWCANEGCPDRQQHDDRY